jgi:two-component sensor histidine kinase
MLRVLCCKSRKPTIARIRSLCVRRDSFGAILRGVPRNQWHGIEIEELVRAQLAPFADLIGPRIVMHGSKLRLNATSGQAIGLALHELATNAGKYGALSTDTGCVDIRWGRDNDTFTMSWTERDGPPVSVPKRRGFGTTVMEAMAERSVEGNVDLDYPPSGLAWRLTDLLSREIAGAPGSALSNLPAKGRLAPWPQRRGATRLIPAQAEGREAGMRVIYHSQSTSVFSTCLTEYHPVGIGAGQLAPSQCHQCW